MLQRICPKCKNNLYNSSYYFCSFCGETLPEDMVLKPKFDKVKKQSLRSGELKHVLSQENIKLELALLKIPKFKFSRHLIYALVAIILVLSGTFFVYKIPVGSTSLKTNS